MPTPKLSLRDLFALVTLAAVLEAGKADSRRELMASRDPTTPRLLG